MWVVCFDVVDDAVDVVGGFDGSDSMVVVDGLDSCFESVVSCDGFVEVGVSVGCHRV